VLSRPSLFSPRWRRQLVTYFLSIQPVVILTFNSKRVQVRPVHVTYTSTCYLFEIIDSSVVSDKCKQMALCHVGPLKSETNSLWGSSILKEISHAGHTNFEFHDSPGSGDVLGPPLPPRPWVWPWDVRCSWWRGVECPIWTAWCLQAPTAAWFSGDRTPCLAHACERVPARSLRSSAVASHGCISHLHRHRGQGSIRPHGVHSLHHVFGEAYPARQKHGCNASSYSYNEDMERSADRRIRS